MNDLVSVIIPSYNRFEYLLQAVESVLNQTYDNIEIIIVMMSQTIQGIKNILFQKIVK